MHHLYSIAFNPWAITGFLKCTIDTALHSTLQSSYGVPGMCLPAGIAVVMIGSERSLFERRTTDLSFLELSWNACTLAKQMSGGAMLYRRQCLESRIEKGS